MSDPGASANDYDVFLSYGTPDREWVRGLKAELEKFGLTVFQDGRDLRPGDNWVLGLSGAMLHSRSMALVLTAETLHRKWVVPEWTSFLAAHGPTSGRLVPILLEDVALPPYLNAIQAINARDLDTARVARELIDLVGRRGALPEGDVRTLYFGQHLVFVLELEGDAVTINDSTGRAPRTHPAPWRVEARFTVARIEFARLTREPVGDDRSRAELHGHAATLGGLLFDLLFDAKSLELLHAATIPGQPRPLVTIRSDDDLVLSLPWELLHHDGRFLVHDGDFDLVRSIPRAVGPGAFLQPPAGKFALVVNVSAPEGSGLDYEAESYRLTRALTDHCELTPTELGTLDDLVQTVAAKKPTGIHFSGHGGPGVLSFEDDEGRARPVAVGELTSELRKNAPEGLLPPFFYLANCHGNDPAALKEGQPGVESLAARLHREGVAQVVAYAGPILDVLSTEAEATLYAEIAAGHTTRFAVRRAREAMTRAPALARSVYREATAATAAQAARDSHPLAWSQLVLYHRGADHPLSPPPPLGKPRPVSQVPDREFLDAGTRRILTTGFIGRRTELHRLRRRLREGQRVFVLQGLGGLGKSTLALHMVRDLLHAGDDLCPLWCQDAEKAETSEKIAEALGDQLLEYGRNRFGAGWDEVVREVDRLAGDDPAQRFECFLDRLLSKVERLVVYLDNLESLLFGPGDDGDGPPDPAAFGQWRTAALAALWSVLDRFARGTDKLHVVASCRYRHDDFRKALVPVPPLPDDALFRLMGWFDGLRRLSTGSRARLVERLAGHPRAVEYADDLIQKALEDWEDTRGPWRLPDPPTADDLEREWSELVEPALPRVESKLWDNLLLGAIWDRVLDESARHMLFRMTLLRQPWEWDLVRELGEEGEPPERAEVTAGRLRRTSLLEQVDLLLETELVRHFTIHPATAQFVARRFGADPALRLAAHRRVGTYYEARAQTSRYLEDGIEAGHHLFQAGEYARSYELLGEVSSWLQNRGRVREGLHLMKPFLAQPVRAAMTPDRVGGVLGTVGLAYADLGQVERAIGFYEQALIIHRAIGSRQGEGSVLGNLGSAFYRLGQVERAIGFHEQALIIHREIGYRQGEGNALGNLGLAYADLGQVERTIGFYEQALIIDRAIGDRQGEGTTLGNLGLAYADLGQAKRAISSFEQALIIHREIGNRQGEGNALGNLGSAFYRLGQVERAISFHEQVLIIHREIGDRQGEGNALGNLGLAYADLGQVERAIGFYEQALVIHREIGNRRGEGSTLGNLGIAYASLGQVERAIGFYEQALIIDREIRDRRGEGTSLGNLSLAYAALGQVERAADLLEQALRIGQEIKAPDIVQFVSSQLERLRAVPTRSSLVGSMVHFVSSQLKRLRGGGGEARPGSGG